MVSTSTINKVINFVLLQLIWFTMVIGAAYQHVWLGIGLVIVFLVWQLHPSHRKKNDLKIVITLALSGLLLDSLWLQLGLISYQVQWPFNFMAPLWILMLWIAFALTVNHSLAWVFKHKVAGFLFVAIGGPMTYLAAEQIGAVTLHQPQLAFVLLVGGWACVMLLVLTVFSDQPRKRKTYSSNHRETSWN